MQKLLIAAAAVVLCATPAEADHKVDICHFDADTGTYTLIRVAGSAVAKHVANHGDVFPGAYAVDADGDGYGDVGGATSACPGAGFVADATDCDDGNAGTNPGAAEVCGDGVDNDCDGEFDEGCVGCVDILLHCDANSAVLETKCGAGVHPLLPNTAANISYVAFGGDVNGVILHHCAGGALGGAQLSLAQSTNLCALQGGCCAQPRWNDEVCAVELF